MYRDRTRRFSGGPGGREERVACYGEKTSRAEDLTQEVFLQCFVYLWRGSVRLLAVQSDYKCHHDAFSQAEPRGVATGLYFGAERRVWLTTRQLRSFWAHRTARIDTSHR